MRTWDRLSAAFVRGLRRPGKFYDGGGLMLQATATKAKGVVTKAWLYRYQIDKSEHAMGLGSARVVTLAEARAKANEARKLVAAGIDPLAARKAERMAARAAELRRATFGECVDGLLTSHGDGWRAKHLAQWRNSMRTYCAVLNGIAVTDVDVSMVLRVLEPDWRRAPYTMDRVRRRIGEVLGYAEVRGLRPAGPLPTRWKDHLDKLLPHPRTVAPIVHHAALAYSDVPRLYQSLTAANDVTDLCLAFVLLTLARSWEARGARWDEFDKAKIWTVPPVRMKREREHRVPLSAEALALIERLPRIGECLFVIEGNSKPIVAQTLRKALKRHAGEGLTVHGLRSSFRTWADERTNYPREMKEVALAHSIGDATEEAYARSDLVEKRRKLMQAWATFLAVAPLRRSDAVIPLGTRHYG
jgi:integrase